MASTAGVVVAGAGLTFVALKLGVLPALAQVAVPVQFPVVIVVVAIVLLILLMRTASMHKRHSLGTDQRLCRGCGTSHPSFAVFCRRCGRKL
jgi:ribosomal protein L40E